MLRCGKVPISKLVSATAEVMVQIPKERIPLLDEIYMVAEKEEQFKAGGLRMLSSRFHSYYHCYPIVSWDAFFLIPIFR